MGEGLLRPEGLITVGGGSQCHKRNIKSILRGFEIISNPGLKGKNTGGI